MSKGFFNKVLWIDLLNETFDEQEISDEIIRQYIGGFGLGVKLLYDNLPAKIDPLGPEAILGFFPGLLTSTVAPLTGRFMVVGKSPLTGGWGDANCGGYFGPEIKKCGYDGILFKGKANTPKIVTIIDGQKEIVDASDLWGLDVVELEDKLKEKYGNIQAASIGQAGEKLSLVSGIVNDKGRLAARSGLGAVMGSKKLKALVLKGNKKIALADKDTLVKLSQEYNNRLQNNTSTITEVFKTYGTTGFIKPHVMANDTPIKNWGGTFQVDFPKDKWWDKFDEKEILKYKKKSYGCFSCPVRCGAICEVPELGIKETHRPEYETFTAFGHLCLNGDLMSIFRVNDICNRGGIDTISTGGIVAFAIECYENGLLTKDETDGLELTWGNAAAIIELTKKIINREGIGDLLADGVKIASEKIGKGSEKYAIHAGGQELPMHHPKAVNYFGASYLYDPTPGRHTTAALDNFTGPVFKPNGMFEGFVYPRKFRKPGEERKKAGRLFTGLWQSLNSLGFCYFVILQQQYPLTELINAATGWDINIEEIITTGLRIQTLRQAFNLREGINILKNKLPERAMGIIDHLEDYRSVIEKMGWNPDNGYPTKETLADLNLDFLIKDLY